MKIIKDEKRIKRNGTIGQYTSLGALVVLGLGMYISFTRPELFTYSLVCLAIGFIMTQIGMYMGSRWGRSPRPDEKLDAGLKGLHSEFIMFHYTTPVSHLLVGPSGVWVILPLHQGGQIFYDKKRWRVRGGGFFQAYMRIFGQEGIGRPDLEAEGEAAALKKFLTKKLGESNVPEIKPILVFTNEKVELEANESLLPAIKIKQLKEFMRQGAKSRALSGSQINQITELFSAE
ncbi:MAG: nuclease-related domain-containing protein [Anaerolineales bacterium]|nr:nuclease-related domain-containing protein [Anaerolineales bacterium]